LFKAFTVQYPSTVFPVWSPVYKSDIRMIETVQKKVYTETIWL